jgi:penicillin-binding protein 2
MLDTLRNVTLPFTPAENSLAEQRLQWLSRLFLFSCCVIVAKAIYFEWTNGAAFRAAATHPRVRYHSVPAQRGVILARDGTILAEDLTTQAVAVLYRYLEEPTNPDWLRAQAKARLTKTDRRNADKLQAEEAKLASEITTLRTRIAKLCRITPSAWAFQTAEIQNRVSTLANHVNARREQAFLGDQAARAARTGLAAWLVDWITLDEAIPPPAIIVAEELDYHVMADDITPDVIAEILQNPTEYRGVRIVPRVRRVYPEHSLAGNLIGYLGEPTGEAISQPNTTVARGDRVGKQGIEANRQAALCGMSGKAWEQLDRLGGVTERGIDVPPTPGNGVTLTLDAALQKSAEHILDDARAHQRPTPASAALLVMDATTGEILTAASEPRFDPNVFASPSSLARQNLLADQRHPLLERCSQMALPPGSVFKIVTSLAAIADGSIDAKETLDCQGYYAVPERERCLLFRRQGMGHGPVDFATALAASCNVYFYQRAMQVGPRPLLRWAELIGFGSATGCDFSTEAKGSLIQPDGASWNDTQTRAAAIGQSTLTATPLQVARLLALIANGHLLPTPHLVKQSAPPAPVEVEIPRAALTAIRAGLASAAADEIGTAHDALLGIPFTVAGKTGSAQGGKESESHAWFAGYAPADAPKYVFVVALEQGGDGGTAAAPLARQLLLRMAQLGMIP